MGFSRAVVTGGAGFLGPHVCEALLRCGTEVVCVDDFRTGSRDNPPERVAAAIVFALTQPAECEVRELVVAHAEEPSWP